MTSTLSVILWKVSFLLAEHPVATVASKAPLIVDLNDNGDTLDVARGSALSELMLPLEITPSFSSNIVGRRPLIEEIDDSVSSNTSLLAHSSS